MSSDLTPEEQAQQEQAAARADARWRHDYITYLATRAHLRAILQALDEKLSYSEIASQIGVSEGRVEELAGLLEGGQNSEESAFEVIVRVHIEGASRQELIQRLAAWEWPEVAYDPYAVPPKSWYRTHRDAVIQKLMTPEEVDEINYFRDGGQAPYVPVPEPTAEEKDAQCRERQLREATHSVKNGERNRAVIAALAAGSAPAKVAELLGLELRDVESVISSAKLRPWIADLGPKEIVGRALLEKTDRAEMVNQLSGLLYWGSQYAPYPIEGSVQGTWAQLENCCFIYKLISEEEYETVKARRGPLKEQDPINWFE